MKARVIVTLKNGVLDPQGKAICDALQSLHYPEVKSVREGKYFELELDGLSRSQGEARVAEMSQKLLANPVIEDFTVQIVS